MTIFTDLASLFQRIVKWLKGVQKNLHPAILIAENVLNALKTFDSSGLGKTVESIIELYVPASTGLINAFFLQLPKWLIALKLIDTEVGKSLTEIWSDAIKEINAIEDPNVRAAQLNSLKALFINFFVQNSDKVISPTTPFTIQHALLLSQPTHNPDLVSEA